MKTKLIHILGGYSSIEDAIDAIKVKDSKEKYEILTLAVKKLFNTIGSDDILKQNLYGQWMFQGKTMNKAQQDLIKAEAKIFVDSALWKILQADIQYQANKKMFTLATTEMQIAAGKLWTYTLDCIKTRLTSLNKDSALFNKE